MIIKNQIMVKKQNCIHKKMIFIKTLPKMLKLDLILEIVNQIDHCLNEKIKQ